MKICINGKNTGKKYWGAGMVSGNNSSRLLLDYKYENPEAYREILEHIFGAEGLCITHLKLEMGADINSTSGTEPCVKRSENEPADVTRGAGYILAADAKKVNPDLTLDMLFWSEPRWVTDSQDVYDARYRWYAETLKAAYEKFGLKFDFVSVNRNERAVEGEWIKYFSKRLKSEKDCSYDFSRIKIVAADEDNSWQIGDLMMADEELRQAVDVIGSHYTSHSTENVMTLADKYGKTVWFTEGSPPMSYSKGTARFDGSGLAGINGVLEIAARIAAMYPCGKMTMYEYQPVAASYYDGVRFCHKQLIRADEPWSGYFSLDSGYYMALHFGRFFKKGWHFIDGACFCDGEKGGDGHSLVNIGHCFATAADVSTGDYSTVIINTTDKELVYDLEQDGLKKASCPVEIWETSGPGEESCFRKAGSVTPEKTDGGYGFSVTVKPLSMITVTTLDTGKIPVPNVSVKGSEILSLPYYDDLSYSDYGESYLPSRGYAPRYTTDYGGAFEVRNVNGKNLLTQIITPETKAMEWGETPDPVTNFGDDRWYNYKMSADIYLQKSDHPSENYAGIGIRYNFAAMDTSGCLLLVYEDGRWKFCHNRDTRLEGSFKPEGCPVRVSISAEGRKISGQINGEQVFEYTYKSSEPTSGAGRAALYSSYDRNSFGNIEILPLDRTYVSRYDDTDDCFGYSDGWEHNLMSSFADYRRTVSLGGAGESLTLDLEGSGFGLFGANDGECIISVKIDGELVNGEYPVPKSDSREIFYSAEGLGHGRHTAEIAVKSGVLSVDGVQIAGKL
ncbi:MAG: glycosyl hydrolase family 59 [Oscillospiraceae bacterium]|nr:glycosyl hydrolase family 59 [Oscillospiraceae bacterium]